jgi:F-type H+/Na+-transporting ATPase subunit alpha
MENKMPDLLSDFKKGQLPEAGMEKMTQLAKSLATQFAKA